ncbi:MAG: hypothetical protein WDZ59_13295 [Pirellulales bacterium]
MAGANLIRYGYLAAFSRPRCDRMLYRLARRTRTARLVEIGLGSSLRTGRLLQVCQRYAPGGEVSYTLLDQFEARTPPDCGVSLKSTYRMLAKCGVRTRLLPGDPGTTLARHANELLGTDLLLISAVVDPASLDAAWYYVPRMLHPQSVILIEERTAGDQTGWRRLSLSQIAARTDRPHFRRAA